MQGLRGLFLGLDHGLFKTKETKDMCLDDDTSARIMKILNALIEMNLSQLQGMIGDGMVVVNNLGKCSLDKFSNLGSYCFSDSTNCSPDKIMNNA